MGEPYISLSSVTEAERVGHFAPPAQRPPLSTTFCPYLLPFYIIPLPD